MLRQRLDDVHQRLAAACRRAGRDVSSVTLIGVTKTVPVEVIRQALQLGLTELAENRVQDAREKQLALSSRLQSPGKSTPLEPTACSLEPIRWHMVGHLQRNKAKAAVELFNVIQSVDSLRLLDELERHLEHTVGSSELRVESANSQRTTHNSQLPLRIFIQVNIAIEATKSGCLPAEAAVLAGAALQRPHLRLEGLMAIPPPTAYIEEARPHFRRLRLLRDEVVARLGPAAGSLKLSMGMSQDFEVAIEEGADVVRIGTAIFGERSP